MNPNLFAAEENLSFNQTDAENFHQAVEENFAPDAEHHTVSALDFEAGEAHLHEESEIESSAPENNFSFEQNDFNTVETEHFSEAEKELDDLAFAEKFQEQETFQTVNEEFPAAENNSTAAQDAENISASNFFEADDFRSGSRKSFR